MYIIYTPLEQFQILSFLSLNVFCFDFSITNLLIINFITIAIFYFFFIFFSAGSMKKSFAYYIIPNNWQLIIETLYDMIAYSITFFSLKFV